MSVRRQEVRSGCSRVCNRSGITSDPNNPDDPEYIVRLVGQVVRVSVETVKIVSSLPEDYGAGKEQANTKATEKK